MSDDAFLNEETLTALDDAAWEYIRKVKSILEKHTDEELTKFGGGHEEFKSELFDMYARRSARMEVMYREMYRRAKPTLNSPDFSGAFCVFHDCDAKHCRE